MWDVFKTSSAAVRDQVLLLPGHDAACALREHLSGPGTAPLALSRGGTTVALGMAWMCCRRPWWSLRPCRCVAAEGTELSPLGCQAESCKNIELCNFPFPRAASLVGDAKWAERPQGL